MRNSCFLLFAVLTSFEVRDAANIMLSKPSVQSSTANNYLSRNANDGNKTGFPSATSSQRNPYWQGDLQGYYTVTSISVSSDAIKGWATYLQRAFIGVSGQDINCSEEVIRCGQWPNSVLPGKTINFTCPYNGPVRFVKIWREEDGYLVISEVVVVEGKPATLTGIAFDNFMSKKIIRPSRSLSVDSVFDCSNKCYGTHSCLGFGFSESATPNCLLATDVTMTTDVKWVSYNMRTCFDFKALNCQMDD